MASVNDGVRTFENTYIIPKTARARASVSCTADDTESRATAPSVLPLFRKNFRDSQHPGPNPHQENAYPLAPT